MWKLSCRLLIRLSKWGLLDNDSLNDMKEIASGLNG